MKKAFFFDRDGVINIDTGYVHDINSYQFMKGIFDFMTYVQNNDFLLFIVTNQSGIGRSYFSEDAYNALTQWLLNTLSSKGIHITKVAMCPHRPNDNCDCRKPKPKMVLDLAKEFSLDLSQSWFIGDKLSDIQCGRNAGVSNTILLSTTVTSSQTITVPSLNQAQEQLRFSLQNS